MITSTTLESSVLLARGGGLAQAARWGILATFAYLLMMPVGHTPALVVALLIMAASSVFLIAADRRTLAPELRVPAILSAAVMLLGALVGIGNPGWVHSLIAWAAAPILFWTWSAALSEGLIRKLLWVAVWATIALSAVTVLIAFTIRTPLPATVLHPIFGGDSSGFGFGAAVAIYGTSTLMATAPMWIVGAVLPRTSALPHRRWMIVAAACALLATAVSSRRAAVALAILIPILILIAYWLTRDRTKPVILTKRARWFIVSGAAVVLAGIVAASSTPGVQRAVEGVIALFTGQVQTPDDQLRLEQVSMLWHEFLESPVWGNGIGMTIDGYSRHETRPWAFEMQYNMLLAQVGILGAALLTVAVVLIVFAVWKAVKARPDLRPVIAVTAAAALSILVGNALNPMLQAPGHFWSVFLLIACVNVALRTNLQRD